MLLEFKQSVDKINHTAEVVVILSRPDFLGKNPLWCFKLYKGSLATIWTIY